MAPPNRARARAAGARGAPGSRAMSRLVSRGLRGHVAATLVATSLVGIGAVGGASGASAGASTAAPVAAPAATSISIRAVQPTITVGRSGTLVGNLQVEGLSAEGREVALEARAKGEGAFTPVGTALAGVRGNLRLEVRPEVTTRYRWSYAGAEDAQARTSGVATLRVRTTQQPARRLSTTLSARAVRGVVTPGARSVLRGTLRSGERVLAGRSVVLLSRTATQRSWQFRTGRATGSEGQVAFRVRPKVRTTYRLAYAGSAVFRPTTSAVVEVDVRPTVSIMVEPPEIEAGESTLVGGTVVHGPSPVAGASVELRARAVAPGERWGTVDTGTTAADGTVSFTVRPDGPTRYRLRVAPAAGLPAARSRAVEVHVRAPATGYGRSYAATGSASRTVVGVAPTRAGPIR